MLIINSRFLTQPLTGVQRFAVEISRQLKSLYEGEIKFVAPRNIRHEETASELGVEIIGTRTGHLWEQTDLPQYLLKNKNPLLLNLANTAPLFYKNKIVTVHDIAFRVYPQTYDKRFLYYYKVMVPTIIRTSRHVVTVSNFSKRELVRFYNVADEKIAVVYNAVNESFCPTEDDDLQKENYFLAVSSLNHRKNLVSVLQAFDDFSRRNKNTNLYLAGDLNTRSFAGINLDKYMNNPRIKILGRVSNAELIRYYSNARAFLYPSLYEGFGIPPLEAQQCNCPAMVSEASCLPEIFLDSALYCNPLSMDSIQANMLKLLDGNVRETLIAKGRENAKRFSWEKSARQIIDMIKTT
jgi:glycosyltransferase involved in cell wall biosynthesis